MRRSPSSSGEVLRLVREDGVDTRAELGRLTGLSRPAVAARVNQLIAHGLLVERADGASTGGRPPARLEFNAAGGAVLVANLGRSRGQAAVCDLSGTLIVQADVDLPADLTPAAVLPRLLDRWTELLAKSDLSPATVRGAGLAVPDPVGLTPEAWDGVEVTPLVAARFDVPVLLDNDVNAAALGEHRTRFADLADLLFVKVSTGIGGGLIMGGRIQRGALGAAGEIGHVPVPDAEEFPCRCGNLGCLEAIAGGAALLTRSGASDLAELSERARAGDPATVALVRDAGRRLGEVIATAVNLLNPAVVVLGGDLTGAYEPLIAGVREVVYRRGTALATGRLRIEPSRLGDTAGLIGCAVMTLDHLLSPDAVDTALASA